MPRWGIAFCAVLAVTFPSSLVTHVRAEQLWTLRDGTLTLYLRFQMEDHPDFGVSYAAARNALMLSGEVELSADLSVQLAAATSENKTAVLTSNHLRVADGLRISSGAAEAAVFDFVFVDDDAGTEAARLRSDASVPVDGPYLELHGFRIGVQEASEQVTIPIGAVTISDRLASLLGDATLARRSIGSAVLRSAVQVSGGEGVAPDKNAEQPIAADTVTPLESGDGGVAAPGPDMVFCQLYGLQQYGRLGDIVGLAIATTSWNVGGRDMLWFGNPDNRHPFIVSNLYRLKNDRFEQIGMSHVKHGFYALGDTQCGGTCTYEPGHGQGDWLGVGCSDTYSSGLNASQSGLGPRSEFNGWAGAWTYTGSHMSIGHSHNAIQHRLQARDADLNPPQNPAALYYAEGYYLTVDDINPMNSASWKPVTIAGGSPGSGAWTFGMSSSAVQPTRGWAIDTWSGARQTILAQVVPPVRFQSPDGRCVLGAKATDLGGGQWHYEYALLNVDMDRKGGSFSVPIPAGVSVTNVAFHAVESHDEPVYSNDPWTATVDSSYITWSTANNPLRWATLYNFRFDADAPPGDVIVTLGLYEPGSPGSVFGTTTGPFVANPAPVPLSDPTGLRKTRFVSVTVPPAATASAGLATALRVTLTGLHHVDPPYTGGSAADFSAFEGQVRWVGPPIQYVEAQANPATFYASTLQCTPYYQDWSGLGLLHITGLEILPSSTYTIENIPASCLGLEDTCANASPAVGLTTTRWGDIVYPFSPSVSGQPNFGDIAALVSKFKNVAGAPIKAQAVITGDTPDLTSDVGFAQISACVNAFKGAPYPYSGPSNCP